MLLMLRQLLVLKAEKRHKYTQLFYCFCFFVSHSKADGHDLYIYVYVYVCMLLLSLSLAHVDVLAVCSFVYLHDNL